VRPREQRSFSTSTSHSSGWPISATAEDLLLLVEELVLPQHAEPRRLRDRDHAIRRLLVARQDVQQRRLAGAVGADQAVALAGVELERRTAEQDAVAVHHREVRY
jgi:hypothetical protein